jgi:dienelactone hydrolase
MRVDGGSMPAMTQTPAQTPTDKRLFIDDEDFDGQFRRTLQAAMRGSADLGEAFAVAARIQPGDFASWAREWQQVADRALREADESLNADDVAGARRGYLRASEYYRQAFFYARTDLDDPFLHSAYTAHVNAFRAAMPLLGGQTTIMELGGEITARGYLFRPDASDTPRPTVIAPAGYDSTAESGYVLAVVSALEHDMNCLVFEGPGQGGVLFRDRIPFRPDYEAVMTPVVDWLLTQRGVDPDGVILLGRSFAGYLAPRAATAEHRICALVCDPAQYDFGAALRGRLGEAVWNRLQAGDPTLEADLATMVAEPHAANEYGWRMVAHGTSTLTAYLRELSRFTLAGVADRISCRTLALEGEGDFAGTGQLQTFADALTAPVVTHRFTEAEGAGGHCEGLGQDRFDQFVYGWLTPTPARHKTSVTAV